MVFITAKTIHFFQKNFKTGFLGQTALDKNKNFRNGRARCADEVSL
jgi:hypothetical protein